MPSSVWYYFFKSGDTRFIVMNQQEIRGLLSGYCQEQDIPEIVKINQRPAVASGENHLSVVTSVDVTAHRRSGEQITFSLICKTFPKGLSCVKFLEETNAFKKEIIVYSDVLPKIVNLVGPQCSDLWPALCGYRPYDILILSDLKAEGFSTLPRRGFLNLEHSLFALKNLAKFHAWSKVLMRERAVDDQKFISYHLTANPKAVHGSIGKGVKSLGKAMQHDWPDEWKECGRAVEVYSEFMAERLGAQKSSADEKLRVLNHGDYWTNNLMFRHSTDSITKDPVDIRLLDFQMVHINSLGWDLTYFLHSSVQPEVRRENLIPLVQEYHQILQKTMKSLNFDLNEIPTLRDILQDLDRLIDLQIVATCFFRLIFTSKHLYDVEAALSNSNEHGLDGLDPKTLSDPDYITHSGEDIRDLMSKGLLQI